MREAEYSEAAVEVLDILNHTNNVIYANLSLISLGKSACVYPSPIPFVTSSGVSVGRL